MKIRLAGAIALCSANAFVLATLLGCGGMGGGFSGSSTGTTSTTSRESVTNSTTDDAGVPPVPEPTFVLQLSTDDSTSMASAEIAKAASSLAYALPLHRHEFMNYYDPPAALMNVEPWAYVDDVAPSVHLSAEILDEPPSGAAPGELTLFMSVQADAVPFETRRPWNLVYCVDVSGSMTGDKIDFVRKSLLASLARMRDGDHVTVVTFNENAHRVITNLAWPASSNTIRNAFSSLTAGGSTNMIAGLNLAYQLAEAQRTPDRLTRVMLFGDGDANVGDTDVQHFRDATRAGNEEGVYLTSVGVGWGFDWIRMDQLADAGKGASVFIPDAAEAMRLFGTEQFTKLVEIASDEVHIEIELPNGLVVTDFSGEEYTTLPDVQLPSVVLATGDDLTMIARLSYTDVALLDEPATIRVSMRPLGTGTLVEWEQAFPSIRSLFSATSRAYRRAVLVDDWGRIRAHAPGAPTEASLAAAIDAFTPSDPGLVEIRGLLRP